MVVLVIGDEYGTFEYGIGMVMLSAALKQMFIAKNKIYLKISSLNQSSSQLTPTPKFMKNPLMNTCVNYKTSGRT